MLLMCSMYILYLSTVNNKKSIFTSILNYIYSTQQSYLQVLVIMLTTRFAALGFNTNLNIMLYMFEL